MYILGVSCYYHDAAACLLKNGVIVAAAGEERFTRIKHDSAFPRHAIDFCLTAAGIKSCDLDYVVFHEKPFLKFERIAKTILSTYPRSYRLFHDAVTVWFKEKLWIKATLCEFLDISPRKILFSQHHLSHASSAFLCSPYHSAAILTADGVGEWATTSLGKGEASWGVRGKNNIDIFEQISFPHSLGLLYSVFTAFLGFEVNEGEYKVMGMSAFGKPRYQDKIYKLIRFNRDGSFRLNMDYFSFYYSTRHSYNKKFIALFGPPRDAHIPFMLGCSQHKENMRQSCRQEISDNQRFADIAASIQKVTEEAVINIAHHLHKHTGMENLCLAGGVALNCVANYRLLKETPFKSIFIQPAAGDAGAALGASLYAWHIMLQHPRRSVLNDVYLGREYHDGEIKDFLVNKNIPYTYFPVSKELIRYAVDALCDQKVVGWFQGKFEWGPRALGSRSILADPRNPTMKDTVNMKIKFREPFRPFAASVIAEHLDAVSSETKIEDGSPFKFMLYTIPVAGNIPAATHVDGTSRIQVVTREDNPLYYQLIEAFYEQTGIPALLNTSFNLKGEPIVSSPLDAYSTFERSGMDLLILGSFVISKEKRL